MLASNWREQVELDRTLFRAAHIHGAMKIRRGEGALVWKAGYAFLKG